MLKALKAGKPVRVVGTMSGTSLDGVDAAVLVTNGVTAGEAGETAFRPYSKAEQAVLQAALGRWSGPQVEAATEVVETAHAEVLSRFEEVDLIGFHGQTLAHDPSAGRTLQVGDGAILAEVLGVPVVSDFRSNDVKMGGQGAPLAPFYHHALARAADFGGPVAVLNLGGVGNLTWVDPGVGLPEASGALSAFDTGPANAPINDAVRLRCGLEYDKAGAMAVQGEVDDAVLTRFLGHRYFAKMPPKSLDRDDFVSLLGDVSALSDVDAIATLTACAAAGVMQAMEHCPVPPAQLFVTGGGRHNTTLMEMISVAVSCPVVPVEDAGWDGDMLEAQAFAYLAARVIRGLPTSCPASTGVGAAVGGGAVSIPEGLV